MSQGGGGSAASPGPDEGFRWPSFVAKCPEYVPTFFYGLSGLATFFVSQVDGWPVKAWLYTAIASFILASLISIAAGLARKQRRDAEGEWIKNAEQEHRDAVANLLGNELKYLAYLVAEAIAARGAEDRRTKLSLARQVIVVAAASMVGQSATTGTRANLFKLSDDRRSMELEFFAGRGDKSDRQFQVGDDTFDLVMRGKSRWVPSVAAETSLATHDLKYEMFLVHPVSIAGTNVYGMLTVDCMAEGELVEEVDIPMMAVLTMLIAMTYAR